jgi:hypothetical protein
MKIIATFYNPKKPGTVFEHIIDNKIMADKIELNVKTRFFFDKTTLIIATALFKIGFKNTTAGFRVIDLSRNKKIVLWYFFYPIIK